MSVDATDGSPAPPTTGPGARSYERYDAVSLDGGDCIVYDRQHEEAWLQSERWVSLADLR